MRSLRWAAVLAVSSDERMADLGVAQLAALLESDLLDVREKGFVVAALDAVYQDPGAEIEDLGQEVEVVEYVVEGDVVGTVEGAARVSSRLRTADGASDDGYDGRCDQRTEGRCTGGGCLQRCNGA